jgi:hypothetical protein
MAIIIVYCVFSLQEIAYNEVRVLQFTCIQSYGGIFNCSFSIDSSIEDMIFWVPFSVTLQDILTLGC